MDKKHIVIKDMTNTLKKIEICIVSQAKGYYFP